MENFKKRIQSQYDLISSSDYSISVSLYYIGVKSHESSTWDEIEKILENQQIMMEQISDKISPPEGYSKD